MLKMDISQENFDKVELRETIFADEKLLARGWLSEEDNEAWKDL